LTLLEVLAAVLAGAATGCGVAWGLGRRRARIAALRSEEERLQSETSFSERESALAEREKMLAERGDHVAEREAVLAERERATAETQQRVHQREVALDERSCGLDRHQETLRQADVERAERERELERRAQAVGERAAATSKLEEQARSHAASILAEAKGRLAEVAGLPAAEARRRLLDALDQELAAEKSRRVMRAYEEAQAEAETRARDVVLTAIQRVAVKHSSDAAVTAVLLPNEEMKGRIIGREGRNVKAFEAATGCDVIVDETPGQVAVSSFDPVRREVARQALATLIKDGRIHPARIEEVVLEARAHVEERLGEEARAALLETDVHDVHPTLVGLLGRLAFRTSYGQNVLRHCVEASHLAGALAQELGLDARLARRAGLLHDIGKAVDHEVAGSHADAAGEIVRRCGEPPEVIAAVEDHHDDLRMGNPYAVLAQVADAISAARPGARQETAERYVQRLKDLETIAAGFAGVERAFAIQAGREVRVIVDAEKVTDAMAPLLAHEIARAVEQKVTFPGEVKVTVVRETRAVDVAR
jgi:ribonuclease Y